MILLPVFGLLAGFAIGRRWAFAVTLAAAAVGFTIVAIATDEIDGAADPFVWVDTVVAVAATALGIYARHLWDRRRRERVAS